MGAMEFANTVKLKKEESLNDAFWRCVEDTQYLEGAGGYTGTIAEKEGFLLFPDEPNTVHEAVKLALSYLNKDDERISDKWGPAGAIRSKDGYVVFFGWASS